jgi:hypothetical protein
MQLTVLLRGGHSDIFYRPWKSGNTFKTGYPREIRLRQGLMEDDPRPDAAADLDPAPDRLYSSTYTNSPICSRASPRRR